MQFQNFSHTSPQAVLYLFTNQKYQSLPLDDPLPGQMSKIGISCGGAHKANCKHMMSSWFPSFFSLYMQLFPLGFFLFCNSTMLLPNPKRISSHSCSRILDMLCRCHRGQSLQQHMSSFLSSHHQTRPTFPKCLRSRLGWSCPILPYPQTTFQFPPWTFHLELDLVKMSVSGLYRNMARAKLGHSLFLLTFTGDNRRLGFHEGRDIKMDIFEFLWLLECLLSNLTTRGSIFLYHPKCKNEC